MGFNSITDITVLIPFLWVTSLPSISSLTTSPSRKFSSLPSSCAQLPNEKYRMAPFIRRFPERSFTGFWTNDEKEKGPSPLFASIDDENDDASTPPLNYEKKENIISLLSLNDTKVDALLDGLVAPKVDIQDGTKPDMKVGIKVDNKVDMKEIEVVTEDETENEAIGKVDDQVETDSCTEAEIEANTEAMIGTVSDTNDDNKVDSDTDTDVDADAVAVTDVDADADVDVDADNNANPDIDIDVKADGGFGIDADANSDTDVDMEIDAGVDAEDDVCDGVDTDANIKDETETDTKAAADNEANAEANTDSAERWSVVNRTLVVAYDKDDDENIQLPETTVTTETNRLKFQIAELKLEIENVDAETEWAEWKIELLERKGEENDDGEGSDGETPVTYFQDVIDRLRRESDILSEKILTTSTSLSSLQTSSRRDLESYLSETASIESSLRSRISDLETRLASIKQSIEDPSILRREAVIAAQKEVRKVQREADRKLSEARTEVRMERKTMRFEQWDLESRLAKVKLALTRAKSKSEREKREEEHILLEQRKGDLESKLEMEETEGKRRVEESKKELMREEGEFVSKGEMLKRKIRRLVEGLQRRVGRREMVVESKMKVVRERNAEEAADLRRVAEEERLRLIREGNEKIDRIQSRLKIDVESEKRRYNERVADFERRVAQLEKEERDAIDAIKTRMQGDLRGATTNARKKEEDAIRDKDAAIKAEEKEITEAYAKLDNKATFAEGKVQHLRRVIAEKDDVIAVHEAERRSLRILIKFTFATGLRRLNGLVTGRRKKSNES